MIKTIKNKQHYFLGKNHYDENVYLIEPSWDCGWYWGFGYIQTYKDGVFSQHTHFDSLFITPQHDSHTNYTTYFKQSELDDKAIWLLCDYMHTFYTLRKTSDLFYNGNSHYTATATIEEMRNIDIYNKINKELLPLVFEKIKELF